MTRDEALTVLGVSSAADRDEILTAYRELAQMLHPDKFGGDKRLQARAEQQMRAINEARDILLKGAPARSRAHATAPSKEERLRAVAAARAQAAETARLTVVASIRTLNETRRRASVMLAVALIGLLIASRMRGTLRMWLFPLLSTLAIWGVADMVRSSSQIDVLRDRARELLLERDAARAVANGDV